MKSGIKSNFIFDIINTVTNLLFPLITFPYISRVLSPDGIGIASFCQSTIAYIVMIAALGIPTYGTREVSKIKGDKAKLSQFTYDIVFIHAAFSILAYAFALLLLFVPVISNVASIYLIASLHIILNLVGFTWFFQGIEEFRYIAIRGCVFRVISAILLFTFVKDSSDVDIYVFILVIAEAGNNICNLFKLRSIVSFKGLKPSYSIFKRHMKEISYLFLFSVSTLIYFNTDNIMIGFIRDTEAVGYYAPALKIQRLLMGLVLSVSTVLYPRLSKLSLDNKEEFNKLSRRGIKAIFAIGVPIIAGVYSEGKDVIQLFAGDDFLPSSLALYLLAPVIVLGVCSNLISRLLICQKLDLTVLKCTSIGAITNILLNGALIYFLSYNGAAIASTISEIAVLGSMLIIGYYYIPQNLFSKALVKYLVAGGVMFISIWCVPIFEINIVFSLVFKSTVGLLAYLLVLFVFKDDIILPVIFQFINKFRCRQ